MLAKHLHNKCESAFYYSLFGILGVNYKDKIRGLDHVKRMCFERNDTA